MFKKCQLMFDGWLDSMQCLKCVIPTPPQFENSFEMAEIISHVLMRRQNTLFSFTLTLYFRLPNVYVFLRLTNSPPSAECSVL